MQFYPGPFEQAVTATGSPASIRLKSVGLVGATLQRLRRMMQSLVMSSVLCTLLIRIERFESPVAVVELFFRLCTGSG